MKRATFIFVAALLVGQDAKAAGPSVDYAKQIKPIFMAHCASCHGALKQKAGLRLDAGQLILKGAKDHPVIIPGKSADSVLIHALTGVKGIEKMPAEGTPLADEEIALLKTWIDQGPHAPEEKIPANPKDHWAYQPPVRSTIPPIKNPQSQIKNPIDAFVLANLEKLGLTPSEPASKHILLRRVYLDLVGLPPTPEELHAFLNDNSPDAYEKVVDRLLASPRYGERWGRHWMDIWRYSDWAGWMNEVRDSQPHIWRWRDWIIESLNSDKPYDRMIVEMLAGDEIAPEDPAVLRATGFLARNYSRYSRTGWMDNTIEHTSKAFLGTTMNCAKCHDHMYDPLTQKEFYQLRAVFEPYNIRIDRIPGQPDTTKDGITRIFDADAAALTYRFVRGDDRNPDKSTPIPPAPPAILGIPFEIKPVSLPVRAYYQGIDPFIQKETLVAADAAIAAAKGDIAKTEVTIASLKQKLAATRPTTRPTTQPAPQIVNKSAPQPPLAEQLKTAENTLAQNQLKLRIAESDKSATAARIAADNAHYANPPGKDAEMLAVAAWLAEQNVALRRAELAVLVAQQNAAAKPADAKLQASLAEEQKKFTALALAITEKPSSKFTPLTPVNPSTSTGRRTALANWITNRKNPLTARVAVNHLWGRHFGEYLVPTVFDFGLNGKPPTNPALLDYLAVELMDKNWSMKPIHRLIVTSETYRQASSATTNFQLPTTNLSLDPDNRHLWRFPPHRMEAEIVRDSVLFVGKKLDLTMSGPDIDHNAGGLSTPRRSIYFRTANEKQMTFLQLFDAPSPNECYRRNESIVPQQALALANSPLSISISRLLANELTQQTGPAADDLFTSAAFERILTRAPTPRETQTCLDFLIQQSALHAAGAKVDSKSTPDAVAPSADPHQRARENLIHVLLNHNDFVTIR